MIDLLPQLFSQPWLFIFKSFQNASEFLLGTAYEILIEVFTHFVDTVVGKMNILVLFILFGWSLVLLFALSDKSFSINICYSRIMTQ